MSCLAFGFVGMRDIKLIEANDGPADLGTYHVVVELKSGEGRIEKWETGARYGDRSLDKHPLDAERVDPIWSSEASLLETMRLYYMHDDAVLQTIALLTVIRPNGEEITLHESWVDHVEEDDDDDDDGDSEPIVNAEKEHQARALAYAFA